MGDKAIKIEPQDEDNDAEEQQHQKQPPRTITKKVRGGQMRDYYFLQSVNSVDELDNLRFENFCHIRDRKPWATFKSHTIPCTKKKIFKPGERCDFELLALRQESASGTINVYVHSAHNHPIMPKEKRASLRKAKELVPAADPPRIYRTPDNREWTFLRTFGDHDELEKFRRKIRCRFNTARENCRRLRLLCNRRQSQNCQFQLLGLKTTGGGYHIYKFGQHNHPTDVSKPKKKQPAAVCGHCDHQQQKQQGMEVEENEEDDEKEDDEDGQEENEEDEGNEEEDEEGQNEQIEGGDEDDDIFIIKVGQQQEVKREESPLENEPNPRAKKREKKLQNAQAKVGKWMAGIAPNENGSTTEGNEDNCDCALEDEEEDEDDQEGNEADEGNEEEDEDEDEDERIEEDEEDDGTIELGQQQQEVIKKEVSMEITESPLENEATSSKETPTVETPREAAPRVETPREENPSEETLEALEERLQKATAKVYTWMAGIEPHQIGPTLDEWDNSYILKMVEVADQEIRENPEKLDLWRPFLKVALKKCMSQMEDFGAKYKDLIILMMDHLAD